LGAEEAGDVVERDVQESGADDEDAGEGDGVLEADGGGAAADLLVEEEEELPAVDDGEGEEVDDGEVDADEGEEEEEPDGPAAGDGGADVGDADRAAEMLDLDGAFGEACEGGVGGEDDAAGLVDAHAEGVDGVLAAQEGLLGGEEARGGERPHVGLEP